MAYTPFPITPGAGSGGGGGSSGLSNANPADLGTAAPGVATEASRADHVHDLPSAADVGAAATAHVHSGADITSGTVAFDRLPTGTSGTTVAVGNDSRFTDTRTPTDGTVTAAKFATNVLDTDSTLAADSDTRVPSQKAVKSALDGKLSTTGGGKDTVSALGSMSGTVTVDLANGNSFYGTLSGNVTDWTLSNATSGKECEAVIEITQHASAAKTVAYPSSWKWAGGTDHVMSTAVGAVDVIVLRTRDGGTTIHAAVMGKAFA